MPVEVNTISENHSGEHLVMYPTMICHTFCTYTCWRGTSVCSGWDISWWRAIMTVMITSFLASVPLLHNFLYYFKIMSCWLFQENEFFGVMRFFFQDFGSRVSTKCIRVSSTASTQDVLNTLVEKFRPDMRMLTLPKYALYEVHVNGGEFDYIFWIWI